MENALNIVAIKACCVVVLALGTALASRYRLRPGIVHTLWIVVLLQLLVPPVLEVGVLPSLDLSGKPESVTVAAAAVLSPVAHDAPSVLPAEPAKESTLLTRTVIVAWLVGTLALLLLAVVRIRRFDRLLSEAEDAPAEWQAVAGDLAARLGLSRWPRIRLVPSGISPMLWPRLGSLEILFPAPLLERLNVGERNTLLAHELAHVRRRDHWVRYLELAATALFWWHPVVWWARSRLRRAEEECCDGLVLRALPGSSRDYARGLFKTVEFLAGTRTGLPSLASGIGKSRILEGRLAMILKQRPSKTLSGVQRLALALLAAGLLIVFPTWAERASASDNDAELRVQERELSSAEAAVRSSVLDLERQAQDLEQKMRKIRVQQQTLEHRLQRQREQLKLQRLELDAVQREAAGHRRGAEEVRQQDMLREQSEPQAQLEAEVRETLERELAPDRPMGDLTRDRVRQEIAELIEAGELESARRLERELTETLVQREMENRGQARVDRARSLRDELLYRTALVERLEDEGRTEEAAEIESALDELRRRLERADDASGALR